MSGTPTGRVDGNGAAMPAMKRYDGVADVTLDNENEFFAVAKGEAGVMKYVGKDAKLTEKRANGVNMMLVGYEGDDVKKAAEVFKDIAGNNIPVRITIDGEEEPFDRKLPATKTVGNVILSLGKQYKNFFTITRLGTKLEDDMTLAQAAQSGSTVNWIAKVDTSEK